MVVLSLNVPFPKPVILPVCSLSRLWSTTRRYDDYGICVMTNITNTPSKELRNIDYSMIDDFLFFFFFFSLSSCRILPW